MYPSIKIEINALNEFKSSFHDYEELYSFFFEAPDGSNYKITRDEKEWPLLSHFLNSNAMEGLSPHLKSISFENAQKYILLDKHQFEGSLITNLLHGGCYGGNVNTRSQARLIAAKLIDEIFTDEHSWPYIFSMPRDWSEWSDYWAITWTYIIYDPPKRMWWYLSFGSTS